MLNHSQLLWVFGGREYNDMAHMAMVLTELYDRILITGSARGADLLAEELWRENQLPYIGVPAQWAKYGKKAGPMRNALIAHNWKPGLAVAFPGGTGTLHARQLCQHVGIEVIDG